jgi:hypothetical protein
MPSRVPGVMALRYSLAGGAEAGDAIEVVKPVTVAGKDAGRLPIRIDGNAQVFVQASRVAAILAAHDAGHSEQLGDEFVSLERLRGFGIDVRYDAVRDRLILATPDS